MTIVYVICFRNVCQAFLAKREGSDRKIRREIILIYGTVFLTATFHGAFDILKIYDPIYYVVGLEPVATWVMAFANVFLFFFGVLVTRGIFNLSLEQSKFTGRASTKRLLFVLQNLLPLLFIGLGSAHLMATIGGFYSPQVGEQLLFASVVGSNILFISYAFFIPFALRHILRDMENMLNQAQSRGSFVSPNLSAIYFKLRRLQRQFFVQPIVNGIVNFVIALWPFLLRK